MGDDNTNERKGPLAMPLRSDRSAPTPFSGEPGEGFQEFLDVFEPLCKRAELDDADIKTFLLQYVTTGYKRFLLNQYFWDEGWRSIREELLALHPTPGVLIKPTLAKLIELCEKKERGYIHTANQLAVHIKDFSELASHLRKKEKISEEQFNYYFWASLPESVRREAEIIYKAKKNDQYSSKKAYPMKEIVAILRGIFSDEPFDASLRHKISPADHQEELIQRRNALYDKNLAYAAIEGAQGGERLQSRASRVSGLAPKRGGERRGTTRKRERAARG